MEENKFEYTIFGEGNITIVIETGIGNSYYDWLPIVDKIKDNYRILLYHRLGYGFSRKSELPRTTENICKELSSLLKELRIDRFLLLGHSFGGLCSQHYAKLHPDNLLGLILVDSTSPKMIELDKLDTPFIIKHCSIKRMIEMSYEFAAMSKDELALNAKSSVAKRKSYLTDDIIEKFKEFSSSPEINSVVADEFLYWQNDGIIINELDIVLDLPVVIIARDLNISIDNWIKNGVPMNEAEIHEKHWRFLEEELCKLSSNSMFMIADHSDHMIHIDNPEVIIKAIKYIQEKVSSING